MTKILKDRDYNPLPVDMERFDASQKIEDFIQKNIVPTELSSESGAGGLNDQDSQDGELPFHPLKSQEHEDTELEGIRTQTETSQTTNVRAVNDFDDEENNPSIVRNI